VPAGSLASVDGFERPTRLAAAYTQAGFDGQVTASEGLLGVTFSVAEQVDEAGMQALFAPLEPIPVDLPDPVVRTAPDGTVLMQLPAGPQELTAAQAAAVLFTRVANETEYVRLPNQVAVWTGVVEVSDRVAAPATEETPTDVAGFLAAIGAGPRTVVSLSVTPALDLVTNPDGCVADRIGSSGQAGERDG
jgi:anionic cell wall polymer biosynthesis LytR-Cps2A-Psr (LCP) family protein